jgi:hypothetical protein
MKIDLKVDGSAFKTLTPENIQKQARFAMAKTLTGAAFEARKATQRHVRRRLNIRRTFFPNSIVVNKATKVKLYSEVGFLERAWLAEYLEDGGVRTPRRSRTIAIPLNARRGKRGNVTSGQRPRNILQKDNVFIADIDGTLGIWERPRRRGSRTLRLLYALEYRARYRPNTINFTDVAEKVGKFYIKKNLGRNFSDAIASSKTRR